MQFKLISITAVAVVISVAAAQLCAVAIDPVGLEPQGQRYVTGAAETARGDVAIRSTATYRGRGIEIVAVTRFTPEGPSVMIADRRGWPWPALETRYRGVKGSWTVTGAIELKSLTPYAPTFDPVVGALDRTAPLQPVWVGLALDTAVFAAGSWCAVGVVRWIRRAARRRRALCAACSYPVGASPRCPECGAAIAAGTSRS